MAKKNETETGTEVATKQDQPLATAADFGGGVQIEGDEDRGLKLGRVVLFQGTAEEEEMYGDVHKRGDFLDALESRKLGTSIKIMPITGWTSWAKFVQGQKQPIYSTTNKAEVPPEDLEWDGDNPPAATMSINVVVVVAGEHWPYLLIFKRTALKAWDKGIKPIEARRGTTNKTPGLYELTSVDDKSSVGKPFKRLTARSLGDPDPETLELAMTVYSQVQAVKEKAKDLADDLGDGDVIDEPPI